MVAKKKAAGKDVALWDEKLAQYAQQEAGREKMGAGQTISLRGGIMSFNGAEMDDNRVEVVIVEHVVTKAYYEGEYDPDNPQSPACYAYGEDEREMIASDKSADKQAETCEECPHNQWGSAEKGRGKRCKDGRRLALISRDDIEDIENAPVALMNVPPTSIAEWKAYVNKLAKQTNRPPFAFITDIKCKADADSQFKLIFTAQEQFEDAETFEALIAKKDDCADLLRFEYEPPQPAAPKGRGKPAAKAAPKAKAKGRKF